MPTIFYHHMILELGCEDHASGKSSSNRFLIGVNSPHLSACLYHQKAAGANCNPEDSHDSCRLFAAQLLMFCLLLQDFAFQFFRPWFSPMRPSRERLPQDGCWVATRRPSFASTDIKIQSWSYQKAVLVLF